MVQQECLQVSNLDWLVAAQAWHRRMLFGPWGMSALPIPKQNSVSVGLFSPFKLLVGISQVATCS